MRQILVDSARACAAEKRGAGLEVAMAQLPDWGPQQNRQLLAMNDALEQLEKTDPLKAQLIEMRFFGGMTAQKASITFSKPVHVVRRELRLAQAWLRREMEAENRPAGTRSRTEPQQIHAA